MDFTKDNNPLPLHRAILDGFEFPKYASEKEWPSSEDVQDLAPGAFADPINRLHPIHTKAACFVSALYCSNLVTVPSPDIIENIKQAAGVLGIQNDVLPLLANMNARTKQAAEEGAAPDTYALQDGKEHAFYPIGTTYDVETSANGIMRDMRTKLLPVKEARKACLRLVARADQLKLARELLPDDVQILGRQSVARVDALDTQAAWRARQTGTDLYKEAVELFRENPTEENRQAGAEAWELLDDVNNIKTSSLFPSVTRCWFSGEDLHTIKQAARHLVWLGDEAVPSGVLSTVPPEIYESWYGQDQREKVAFVFQAAGRDGLEASALLDTWTTDERAVLAGHLQRHHS